MTIEETKRRTQWETSFRSRWAAHTVRTTLALYHAGTLTEDDMNGHELAILEYQRLCDDLRAQVDEARAIVPAPGVVLFTGRENFHVVATLEEAELAVPIASLMLHEHAIIDGLRAIYGQLRDVAIKAVRDGQATAPSYADMARTLVGEIAKSATRREKRP